MAKILNIDDINSSWDHDVTDVVHSLVLDESSLKIPKLHSKYVKFWSEQSVIQLKLSNTLDQLVKEKYDYYSGKASSEVYRLNPFDLKLKTKEAINSYVYTDKDICALKEKLNYLQIVIQLLEKIIKEISQFGYHIRSAIDYQKFTAGN